MCVCVCVCVCLCDFVYSRLLKMKTVGHCSKTLWTADVDGIVYCVQTAVCFGTLCGMMRLLCALGRCVV